MNEKCQHMDKQMLHGQGHTEQATILWNNGQNMWEKNSFTKGVVMP